MKTRTEITVEMERLIVVNRSRTSAWCSCGSRPADMISVEDADLVAQRLADRPELAETLSALISAIRSHP